MSKSYPNSGAIFTNGRMPRVGYFWSGSYIKEDGTKLFVQGRNDGKNYTLTFKLPSAKRGEQWKTVEEIVFPIFGSKTTAREVETANLGTLRFYKTSYEAQIEGSNVYETKPMVQIRGAQTFSKY